jgi:hypothetical protein
MHPYGPPDLDPNRGDAERLEGIASVPAVRATMATPSRNNIIVTEVGYCAPDVGPCTNGQDEVADGRQAARLLTETLDAALVMHRQGWLKALVPYSRDQGGWAMQRSDGSLTPSGAALAAFAASPQGLPASSPSVVGDAGQQWIYYVGGDGAVWRWSASDSGATLGRIGDGQVAVDSSPVAVLAPGATGQWVYYVGTDGAIHEWAAPDGVAWRPRKLGGRVAPYTSPAVTIADGRQWVDYVGARGVIHQWVWNGSRWRHRVLGGRAAPHTSPVAVRTGAGRQRIYYLGRDGHEHELFSATGAVWTEGQAASGRIAPATEGSPWQWNRNGAALDAGLQRLVAAGPSAGTAARDLLDQASGERWVYFQRDSGERGPTIWRWRWTSATGWLLSEL